MYLIDKLLASDNTRFVREAVGYTTAVTECRLLQYLRCTRQTRLYYVRSCNCPSCCVDNVRCSFLFQYIERCLTKYAPCRRRNDCQYIVQHYPYAWQPTTCGLRQSCHQEHTLHELWARHLSKIHSTVDLYLTTSDLKSVEKSRPSLNTAAVAWLIDIR